MYSEFPRLASALRMLSVDMVEAAKSGHPGMPLGMADIAAVLWKNHLQHHPQDPNWFNRDRFVLSNGHGCALLYALLHVTGYDLSADDLKNFRQMHSKTPGHPEFGHTVGVDATTGPLGQGLAMAVGMAIAEMQLAATFNREGFPVIDHHTYVFAGDGCLMEGISHEAASLAGKLNLNKLIVLYDDNGISIDGRVERWFEDDTVQRFKAYGWQVIDGVDGHEPEAIDNALAVARRSTQAPTLIVCRTEIGHGSPNCAGSESCHGAALGQEERKALAEHLQWPHAPFEVPDDVRSDWSAIDHGEERVQQWQAMLQRYEETHPALAEDLKRRIDGAAPTAWEEGKATFAETLALLDKAEATRVSSKRCLEKLYEMWPELFGGSADLTGSNGTNAANIRPLDRSKDGNYLHYGVREFGMFAAMNGMALHGGLRPFGATFLTFVDYGRNAVRLAALMNLPSIFVLTHDSLALGEDGPTHQPVEHVAMLRATPNVDVWRPADAFETAVSWQSAMEKKDGPSCLILSRQGLPNHAVEGRDSASVLRGGYVFHHAQQDRLDGILVATGSEVELAHRCALALADKGEQWRVVSIPCLEAFCRQDQDWQEAVLPSSCRRRVVIECGSSQPWHRVATDAGLVIGVDEFGASAPGNELMESYGFSVTAVCAKALALPSST